MRFIEYLTEMTNNYGIVLTVEKSSGNFEDVTLFDIDSNKIHYSKDHAQNMLDSLVDMFRQEENWHEMAKFLKGNSRTAKPMGPDYDDDENFTHIMYGPFSANDIGHLVAAFEDQYGDDDHAEDDWDTDEYRRAEFDATEARAINRMNGRR